MGLRRGIRRRGLGMYLVLITRYGAKFSSTSLQQLLIALLLLLLRIVVVIVAVLTLARRQ